ncbi:MAG: NUDIX hydrolase [Elusimicrobiaceae bacterium]|nr:NUDIX hydrolase [Elusimicrobiaceae bacterium]
MSHYSKLKETKLSSKTLYTGVVGFNYDTVQLINGKTASRVYLVHKGASAVLPIEDDCVYLVQQYRYPIGRTTWELPAGKREDHQTFLTCAKAELEQEAGLKASKWKKLCVFNPSNAFSNEDLHIYLARGLKKVSQDLDEDEFVNVKKFPLNKAYQMIKTGKIQDAKTLIALLMYRNFVENK